MTNVITVQPWTVAPKSDGTGSSVTNTLTNVPTPGNLLVAFLANGDTGAVDINMVSFNDNFGDGVSWTPMTVNPVPMGVTGNNRQRGYYKIAGTPSGGGKAVQCTITGTQALALFVAEYGVDSGTPTWSVDGGQVAGHDASSGPANAGSIVATGDTGVLIGFSASDGPSWTPGSLFTTRASNSVWASYRVEDRTYAAPGTYAVDWSATGSIFNWAALGIAFKATFGPTLPNGTITDVSVDRDAGTATLTVTLNSPAPASGCYAHFSSVDVTAVAGQYYTTSEGTLRFAAGETTKTIRVPILATAEGPKKSFNYVISGLSANATLGTSTGTITITLDYVPTVPTVVTGSAMRDEIPKIIGIPMVGTPITYLSARLPGTPAATASRVKVNGVLKASGTTSVSYTPVIDDAAMMVTVEVDYAGPVSTVSMPMPILSDEWMMPTPIVKDAGFTLTSNSQVGTNIYYIDPVGGVAPNLIQAYGWNGTNIIDSTGSTTGAGGVPYGTDPLNPTGPVVASKYSAAILLDVYGNAPGVRVGGAGYGPGGPEYSATTNRRQSSNWYLYKRGTTLDIDDDLTGYIAACATLGTTSLYTTAGLASLGGASWAARQVFGSYGPTSTERATITKKTGGAMVLRNPSGVVSWSNVQYMDLIFNGKVRNPGVIPAKAFSMVDGSEGDRVWATGCMTFGCMNTPVQGGDRHFMFYRTAIIDAFGTAGSGHTQGIFSSGLTGNARMQVMDCFMAQNGFRFDPQPIREAWDSIPVFSSGTSYADEALVTAPDGKIWLARGAKTPAAWTGTGWVVAGTNRKPVPEDVFARNNYWSGKFSATEAFVTRSILFPAASGEQLMRDRGRVESNLFYSGYLGAAGGGGHDSGTTMTNQILDNVFFSYSDGTGSNPAWNMGLAMGAANSSVRRNIVSRQLVTGGYSFTLESVAWEGSGYVYKNPVLNNKVEFNILDTGSAAPVSIMDGYRGATGSATPTTDAQMALTRANYGVGPGVLNNSVSNNWLITTNGAFSTYTQTTGAPATDTTNTTHTGNVTYASRAAAATALGGVDSTRTPATYLTSLGFVLEGTDTDGVKKWVDLWKTQRRGNWNNDLTAVPVINYVRAGFGMAALET